VFNISAVLIFCVLLPGFAFAEEAGYREALEYFIHRKNLKKNLVEVSSQKEKQEPLAEVRKLFIGFGGGEVSDSSYLSVEAGLVFLNGAYFQQSLSLEGLRFDSRDSDAFKAGQIQNEHSYGVFLSHSLQLSSRLFFLTPEVSTSVGRILDRPLRGALVAFKPGLVFSGRWRRGVLFSGRVYYRRHEYFSKNLEGDGVGFSLKVSF
jgi:hypothetical protein